MRLALLELDQENTELTVLARRAQPSVRDRFAQQIARSWSFHEHALEGVRISPQDLEAGITKQPAKDACEQELYDSILRHYQAALYINAEASKDAVIDIDFMRSLHARLCEDGAEAAGRYRKTEGPLGAYMHSSPAAKSISYQVRKLQEFIDDEAPKMHPVRAAAAIHVKFMEVFPFDKRTGSTGRLLLNHELVKHDYPPVVIPSSSRSDYFSALCDGPDAVGNLVIEILRTTIDFGVDLYKSV